MGCSVVVFNPNLSILNPFPIASILSFQGHASRNDMELSDKSDNQTPVKAKLLAGRAGVSLMFSIFHYFISFCLSKSILILNLIAGWREGGQLFLALWTDCGFNFLFSGFLPFIINI